MRTDYKQLLKRYIAAVRRCNVGEDFVDRLPLDDQRILNSLSPRVAHTDAVITSGNLTGGWFSNLRR